MNGTAMKPILFTLLLLVAAPALGQQAATPKPARGACALAPMHAQGNGPRIQVTWAAPACTIAKVRIYRRRQHVGSEAVIHPVVLIGHRHDSTVVQCWDSTFTALGIYEYRAVPVDSTGREGTSSAWISANNLDDEVRPWISSARAEDLPGQRAIRLRWKVMNGVRVRGIVLHRADRFDGPYTPIADLPPTDSSYTDHVQRVKETYFYRIELVDVVGRSTVGMPVQGLSNDEPKVMPPAAVTAEATPHGIVLRWQAGGPDVSFYQVERGAPKDTAFALAATGIRAPAQGPVQWTDSLATDNALRRYRVRAVSIGGPVSAPSVVAMAQAFDGRVPSTPTDVAVRDVDGVALVSWRDPWAGDEGLFEADVERAGAGDTVFRVVSAAPLPAGTTVFRDSSIVAGRAYRYRVVGRSINGLRGKPSMPAEWHAPQGGIAGPRLLTAKRTAEGIALEWAARAWEGKELRLYRSVNGAAPTLLKTLPLDAASYTDRQAVKGAFNQYVLRLLRADGTESGPSEAVGLRW